MEKERTGCRQTLVLRTLHFFKIKQNKKRGGEEGKEEGKKRKLLVHYKSVKIPKQRARGPPR